MFDNRSEYVWIDQEQNGDAIKSGEKDKAECVNL